MAHLTVVLLLTFLPLPFGAEAIAEAKAHAIVDHNGVLFATLVRQLDDGVTPHELRQIVGNFVLVLPFGVYGPMVMPPLRSLPSIMVAGAGLSIMIEMGQLAVATAYGFPVRVADIDDVLLNTLGVLSGYLLWRAWAATGSVDSDDAVRRPADGR